MYNEEAGERRVQLFIGLLTAVMAVLAVFGDEAIKGLVEAIKDLSSNSAAQALLQMQGLAAAAMVALAILLAFGLLTFLRILRRDCVTEEYKAISSYRRRQLGLDDPFDVVQVIDDREGAAKKVKFGGLTQLVAFINGVIIIFSFWRWRSPSGRCYC